MNNLDNAMLIYLLKDNKILLGLKQKKIAAGKWSGYGGKKEVGDVSMHHTAIRELYEETGEGITAELDDLIPQAIIDFTLRKSEGNNFSMKVFIYILENFSGKYCDTNEMKNHTWFPLAKIPYNEMLVDNKLFLPKILNKDHFTAQIISENGKVIYHKFNSISRDSLIKLFDLVE